MILGNAAAVAIGSGEGVYWKCHNL